MDESYLGSGRSRLDRYGIPVTHEEPGRIKRYALPDVQPDVILTDFKGDELRQRAKGPPTQPLAWLSRLFVSTMGS